MIVAHVPGHSPSTASSPSNPINAIAKRLTGRSYISWSQVSTYQQCPARFKMQYVDGLAPAFTPSSLAFGGGVHAGIASHFDDLLAGGDGLSVDHMMNVYRSEVTESANAAPLLFNQGETDESLADLASRVFTAFGTSEFTITPGKLLSIEDEYTATLLDGVPDLLARLDVVTINDDGLLIRDFKTTRSPWSPAKVQEAAGQLLLYAEVAAPRLADEGTRITLQVVTLTKAKTPKLTAHDITWSPSAVDAAKHTVAQVWKGITAGVFPARQGWVCKTCPFKFACPAFPAHQ